jgi:hypothetical protein
LSPRDAATSFLKEIVANRIDGAYAYLCTSAQAKYDRTAFAAYLEAHKFASFSNPPRGTPSSAPRPDPSGPVVGVEYYVLNSSTGAKTLHGIPIVRESGLYRVCGDPY